MRPRALVVLAAVLGLLAAGCGQPGVAAPGSLADSAPPAPPAPVPSVPPVRALVAVFDDSGVLRLVSLDGRVVARATLPTGAAAARPAGAGGDLAAFVDGGDLEALHVDGSVTTLGHLAGRQQGRVAVSADGRQWLWTDASPAGGGETSRLVLSAVGQPDRVLAQETAAAGPRWLQPYRWTPGGAVYENAKRGTGGYVLFDAATGPSWRLAPGAPQPSPLLTGTCTIADLAADGTTACWDAPGPDLATLVVTPPDGRAVRVPLPKPAFTQAGAVSLRPGHPVTTAVVAGSPSLGYGKEQIQTDLVDLATGSVRPFGPAGLRPGDGAWTWLPDGSLIEYRPAGTLGGDPGVYLVTPDGGVRRVTGSGTPVGVVDY